MTSSETIVSLFSIALVAMITPGANNLVVFTVSIGAAPKKTAKACGGIIVGTICLTVVCWFGAAPVLYAMPSLQLVIVGLGCAYLVWGGTSLVLNAWRQSAGAGPTLPSSFWGLAVFQVTNPKAWVLCVSAAALMRGDRSDVLGLIVLATIFGIASALSLAVWAGAGRLLPGARTEGDAPPWVKAVLGLALIGTSVSLAFSAL
ncbi:MAG: LysE family transporter [Rhodospirillaceae bacterium]